MPTVDRNASSFGIASTNGVADHLKCLHRKGLIIPSYRKARTKVLTKRARTLLGLVVPMRTARAREMLLEAAADVAALTNEAGGTGAAMASALAYLWQANELWQGAQIRNASPLTPAAEQLLGGGR